MYILSFNNYHYYYCNIIKSKMGGKSQIHHHFSKTGAGGRETDIQTGRQTEKLSEDLFTHCTPHEPLRAINNEKQQQQQH